MKCHIQTAQQALKIFIKKKKKITLSGNWFRANTLPHFHVLVHNIKTNTFLSKLSNLSHSPLTLSSCWLKFNGKKG